MVSASPSDPEEGARLRREIECLNARIELARRKSNLELIIFKAQNKKTEDFERQLHSSLREEICTIRTEKDAVESENRVLSREKQALEFKTIKLEMEIDRLRDELERVQNAYIDSGGKSPSEAHKPGGTYRSDGEHVSADDSHPHGVHSINDNRGDKDGEASSGYESRRLGPDESVHTIPCSNCREHDIPCIGSQGRMCRACQGLHKRCGKSSQGSTKRKEREQETGTARPAKRQEP